MSKLLWIILGIVIFIIILFAMFIIYICFKIEDLDEKDFNYIDEKNIEKK